MRTVDHLTTVVLLSAASPLGVFVKEGNDSLSGRSFK